MFRYAKRTGSLLGGAALSVLMCGAAYAAAPPPASTEVDEVVVTARKVEERAQDVPISMSAIGGASLAEARLNTVESLSNIVPNVKIFKNVSTNNAFGIYIRGVGRDNGSFFVESPVALYVDDVIYPYQVGPVIDIGGIDRIEVLRGPQGTLYGRNATVGAVKYITSRPNLNESHGAYALTYGSFKRAELSGGITAPIIDGKLGFRLDAGFRSYDGYMYDRTFKENINGYNAFSGRASLLWKPSENTEVYFAIDGTKSKDELSSGTPVIYTDAAKTQWAPFFGDPYVTDHNAARPSFNDTEAGGATLQGRWDVGDITLKSITAYRGYTQAYSNDNRFRADQAYAGSTYFADDATFTQEFQATGRLFDGKVTFASGLFYLNSLTHSTTGQPTSAGAPIFFTRQNARSSAAYVDATWHVAGGLSVSAGVRYTQDQKDATQGRISTTTNYSGKGSAEWTSTTPRIGVDYKINDNLLAYVSWGKGFKGGALNTNAPTTAADIGLFVPPEISKNTEVGIKSEWFDKRFRLNLNYFWMTVANQTTAVRDANNLTVLVFNDVEAQGLEAEFRIRPMTGLTIHGTLGTLDAQYVNIPASNTALFSLADKTPKHNPKLTYDIGAEYEFSPGFVPGTIKLAGDYSYVSAFWGCLGNPSVCRQNAYGLTNLSVTWNSPDDHTQLVLAGTNVGDVAYFKNGSSGNGVLVSQWYLPPAEYSITLRQKF